MQPARIFLRQRHLAALLCAAVLLVKLLVPAGYMIDRGHGLLTVTICSGTAPRSMTIAVPGLNDGAAGHGTTKDHAKAETPCAFSDRWAPALGAVDAVQLALHIAFLAAVGLAAIVLPTPARWTSACRSRSPAGRR